MPDPVSDPVRTVADSYASTKSRFDTEAAAARYSRKHDNARDRREQRCIAEAMAACGLADDSLVLDLPCGTGRLSSLVVDAGHRLVAADSSPHMVAQAVDAWERQAGDGDEQRGKMSFEVLDVMDIGYPDLHFNLVICNRLLHHFHESSTRVRALAELGRVSKRWVIVSFFNADTVDARWRRFLKVFIGKRATERRPISLQQFKTDVETAGLRIARTFPTSGNMSPQWYVLLERC